MPKRRSRNCSSTPLLENSPSTAGAGCKRKKSPLRESGGSGTPEIPRVELSCLSEILEALCSTVKKQGRGTIPFPLFLPVSLQHLESSLREPGILRELITRSIVTRTACTVSQSGSTGWLQVVFSIPRALANGRSITPVVTPTTGDPNVTGSGTATAATISPRQRGK